MTKIDYTVLQAVRTNDIEAVRNLDWPNIAIHPFAMIEAIRRDRLDMLKLIIENGGNINQLVNFENTHSGEIITISLLDEAIELQRSDITFYLICEKALTSNQVLQSMSLMGENESDGV